jgi:hypothetical protein
MAATTGTNGAAASHSPPFSCARPTTQHQTQVTAPCFAPQRRLILCQHVVHGRLVTFPELKVALCTPQQGRRLHRAGHRATAYMDGHPPSPGTVSSPAIAPRGRTGSALPLQRKADARVNVNVNELRLGFSNTTRSPEGILSHNNRKSCRAVQVGSEVGCTASPRPWMMTPAAGRTCRLDLLSVCPAQVGAVALLAIGHPILWAKAKQVLAT